MAKKNQILLLTRNPAVQESLKTAVEGDCHHLVVVDEVGLLKPLLARGAGLVVVDPELPEAQLRETAATLDSYRDTPVLTLEAEKDGGGLARWRRYWRGAPIEAQLDPSLAPEMVRRQIEEMLERRAFLRGTALLGQSPAMQELRERILSIAPKPVFTILVTGESGTGKDLVAQALHRYSGRQNRPFVPINCAAIPENLLESELFGHERGAFTDAKGQRQGLFEQANGGTVFLDEIGEMSKTAQIRLLRVLEQREVTRVGGNAVIPVDIRVIAATNRDLQEAVSQREFRLDLYHRLKVVELSIPPLRRRLEDIPLFIDHFVQQFTADHQEQFAGFSQAAMDLLLDYDWPGNVRELRNLVEYLIFLGPRRRIEPQDLLSHLDAPPLIERRLPVVADRTSDRSERELIYFALLDLKREVAELRRLIEAQVLGQSSSQRAPVYQLESPREEDDTEQEIADRQAVEPLSTLRELEKEAIEQTLRRVGGNRKQTAEILGISPRTLYRKLDEYELK